MRVLFILIVLGSFYSCSSIQVDDSRKSQFDLMGKSGDLKYRVGENRALVSQLINTDSLDSATIENGTMRIHFIGDKRIKFSFDFGDRKIDKIFKGKLRNNEYKLRTRLKVKLFPPVFWVLTGDKTTIFENTDNDLVIYGTHDGVIFVTLIPVFGADNGLTTGTFKEVNQ